MVVQPPGQQSELVNNWPPLAAEPALKTAAMSTDPATAVGGQAVGSPAAASQPPPVSLDTRFPVGQLMGAVDAIEEHHQHEVEEHRRQQQAEAEAGSGGGSTSADAAAAEAAGQGEAAPDGEGKPLGYPGTFFLEKPLTGEEAQTLTRMWPPPTGAPGYPGYPPSNAPGYPPASAPGYPPTGAPSYAPANAPGYPPASAPGYPAPAAPSGSSGAYPQVHHQPPGAPPAGAPPSAPPMSAANPYPSLQPAPMQLPGQPQ